MLIDFFAACSTEKAAPAFNNKAPRIQEFHFEKCRLNAEKLLVIPDAGFKKIMTWRLPHWSKRFNRKPSKASKAKAYLDHEEARPDVLHCIKMLYNPKRRHGYPNGLSQNALYG